MQEINPVHDVHHFDLYLDHRRLSREYRSNYVLVNHYWENSYFIIGNILLARFITGSAEETFFFKTIACSMHLSILLSLWNITLPKAYCCANFFRTKT